MEYIVTRDNDSEALQHYGVLGMKWGVRRAQNRDIRLYNKAQTYASKSKRDADTAASYAKDHRNGSDYLDRSNRYMNKANRVASKMSDSGKSARRTDMYKRMRTANKEAARRYVKRSRSERIKSLAYSTTISTGASFVGMAMGLPVGLIYADTGPTYKLKTSS